jgi:hypothetical protein
MIVRNPIESSTKKDEVTYHSRGLVGYMGIVGTGFKGLISRQQVNLRGDIRLRG